MHKLGSWQPPGICLFECLGSGSEPDLVAACRAFTCYSVTLFQFSPKAQNSLTSLFLVCLLHRHQYHLLLRFVEVYCNNPPSATSPCYIIPMDSIIKHVSGKKPDSDQSQKTRTKRPLSAITTDILSATELVQSILEHLDHSDLLNCRPVCKQFFDLTNTSRALQRTLFLLLDHTRDPSNDYPRVTPHFPNSYEIEFEDVEANSLMATCKITIFPFGERLRFPYGNLWKRMYLTQPPITSLWMVPPRHIGRPVPVKVICETGLTFRHIFKAAVQYTYRHMTFCLHFDKVRLELQYEVGRDDDYLEPPPCDRYVFDDQLDGDTSVVGASSTSKTAGEVINQSGVKKGYAASSVAVGQCMRYGLPSLIDVSWIEACLRNSS